MKQATTPSPIQLNQLPLGISQASDPLAEMAIAGPSPSQRFSTVQSSPPPPPLNEQPEPEAIKEAYLPGMQRRVGVFAGVAIVITSGVASKVVNQAPEYEGNFQLAVASETAPNASKTAIPQPQIQDVNQFLSHSPTPETQIRILKSPKFIEPTLEKLRPQISDLDYATLTKNLQIRVKADQTIVVRYHDTDPQRVKLVLEQLAQTYVDYSQTCRDSVCKGITYIEQQLPQVKQKINTLRQQIVRFRQQHRLTNQDAQIRQFSIRSTEIAKQRAEAEGKLAEARAQYAELQQRMAMQPRESIALAILSKDSAYLGTLRQLRAIDTEIGQGLSQLTVDNEKLKTLSVQYQTLQNQLYQEAQLALQRYVNNPDANLQDPVFQDATYVKLIQQSLSAVAYVQVLDHRHQILAQTEQQIQQQSDQIANLLQQYAEMQQQLQTETQSLQHYFDKLETLKAQADQQEVAWQLAVAPRLKQNPVDEPAPIIQDLKRDIKSGAIVGGLIGVGVAAALEKRNTWRTSQA